jgi:hypothetical protein
VDGFDVLVDLMYHVRIFHCGGHVELLLVEHFANNVAQVLPRTCFGETWNNVAMLETGNWPDMLADEFDAFLGYGFGAVRHDVLSFDGHKGDRNLSLDLISSANHNSLSDLFMFH